MNNKFLKVIEGLCHGICNYNYSSVQAKETRVVNQEIDYDKLGEAVVRAMETSKEQEQNKNDSSATVLGSITTAIFFSLGIMSIVVGVCAAPFVGYLIIKTNWYFGWKPLIVAFEVLLGLFAVLTAILFGLFSLKAAKEVSVEKDRNYIAALASAMTSLVALIVALIAFFK